MLPGQVQILHADRAGITLQLTAPQDSLAVDMVRTTEPGQPQVPYVSALVGVPAGVEIHMTVDASPPRPHGRGRGRSSRGSPSFPWPPNPPPSSMT